MPVSREEAVYAYRLILGREPESEKVIQDAMRAADIGHLREVFLGSPEFVGKYGAGLGNTLPIGRFFGETGAEDDLRCSDEDLQAMFDRIAIAWQEFGRTEPHWSVIVSDAYRQENLSANIDRFYESGRGDIDVHFNFLRRAGLPSSFERALDFGCGVGRLTLALAPFARQAVGVDISPPHLKLAEERAHQCGIGNVRFDALESVDKLDRYEDFDLVISRIVLQHNPPPVMAALFRKLLQALRSGGAAIVQMPTFIPGQSFSATRYLATEQPQMEMNALAQKRIFEIIDETGCRPIEVREDSAPGAVGLSHTFLIQRK